jgi:hypothetical protein
MKPEMIYLDNTATSMLDPVVHAKMLPLCFPKKSSFLHCNDLGRLPSFPYLLSCT